MTVTSGQFYALASVTCLAAAAATVAGMKLNLSAKILMRLAVPVCLLLIPLTGAVTGSFHSPALEIPWWVFGLVNAAISFLAISITLGIRLLLEK